MERAALIEMAPQTARPCSAVLMRGLSVNDGKKQKIRRGRSTDKQLSGGAHCSQIGSQIENACQAKEENNWVENKPRMMPAHVSSNSDPRNSAYPGGDFLHRGYERIGEQHHSEHAISE